MQKILELSDLQNCPLSTVNCKLVLVGGCFDLLHIGHITFLEEAKKTGDILCVLLEPDSKLRKKGGDRPIHDQRSRAKILAATHLVDYIILLPDSLKDEDYNKIVKTLKPAVIATTEKDKDMHHKKRTADLVKAKLVIVPFHPGYSTSELVSRLSDV